MDFTGGITISGGLTITPTTSVAATDPYFMYNSLLLPGNGTNNAQNNTFLDGSTNNFTITRNGNTTQGTYSPYGSNWGNYFNGTSSISIPTVQTTTGSFTAECWFYRSADPANYHIIFGGPNVASAGSVNTQLSVQSNGRVGFVINAADAAAVTAAGVIPMGQWSHIAWVRSGSSCAIFVNGSRASTGTSSGTAVEIKLIGAGGNGSGGMYGSGYGAIGYISNARITTTAVYDPAQTTITVPTSPLTAIAGTTVLTCQSNRFIDNSTNAYSLTLLGTPTIQRFSPFEPTAAYDTSTIGGSGYFDGTGDYLTLPNNSAFSIGASDNFTVELWAYITVSPSDYTFMFSIYDGTNELTIRTGDTGFGYKIQTAFGPASLGSVYDNASYTTSALLNRWTHLAFSRSGGVATFYVNGVAIASKTSNTISIGSITSVEINSSSALYDFSGYLSDIRFVKGTAVYTTAFTPPTAPLTAVANTQLLLSNTNAGIIDNAMMNNLETVGNAQISTTQSKFGGSSMYFDGTTDALFQPSNINYGYSTGDFTIEFWLYLNTTALQTIFSNLTASSGASVAPHIYYANASGIRYYVNSADRITGSALSTGIWYHIAVCRSGSSTKMFINGTQTGSTYTDTNNYGTSNPLGVGDYAVPLTGASTLNGYIDDLRITKGYARYTSNFTAPTSAFPLY